MNDINYYMDIIRELERKVGALTQQLEDERRQEWHTVVVPADTSGRDLIEVRDFREVEEAKEAKEAKELLAPTEPPVLRAQLPSLKPWQHATYVEGVAYEGRNMRRTNADKRFKHFPLTTVAIFASDADARKYLRERDNPGYPKRLGSAIVEVVAGGGRKVRRKYVRRAKQDQAAQLQSSLFPAQPSADGE